MQKNKGEVLRIFLILIIVCLSLSELHSQGLLNKRISVQADHLRLENVLDRIGQKCGFYFSYDSQIIPRDSIVSVRVSNLSVREVLDQLLGDRFEYKETSGYIILRYAPHRLALVTDKVKANKRVYEIKGYVVDERTGSRIGKASVYERKLLRSSITDKDGAFELKIRTNSPVIALTASKELYRDTTIVILSPVDVNPSNLVDDEFYYSTDSGSVTQRTAIGRLLVSYKQKIQDLNVPGFIAESPVQVSITPGLSSHGVLSGQVINKVSLNVFGGYTAGVEGVEAGGWFNINKKHVKGVQAGGLFNMVGTSVTGLQAGGLFNGVLGSVNGMEAAGLANFVRRSFSGVQAAGLINSVLDSLNGLQVAGLANLTNGSVSGLQAAGLLNVVTKNVSGLQAAGVVNFNIKNMSGLQVAGLVNRVGGTMRGIQVGTVNMAKHQSGLQLGVVNIADTLSGAAIGLINIVMKNGLHTVSVSSNELGWRNLEIRTGTKKFYTVLQGGYDYFGLGLGKRINLYKQLCVDPELIKLYIYQGSWDYTNDLTRVNSNFTFRLNKFLSIFAGPSFNMYYSDQFEEINGYALITSRVNDFKIGKNEKLRGWIGWNAGLSLF
ncbi:STN domain-containing protein [Pararcticibacter amylolyticus]|uniref:Secretin/TonB short N-terminal domain-containing protein n=1 Tax=Pararcticibacter amylolyticus TaxID=2173175 RepID=A0A2U2PED3_9SPHI|nr:STN domain-containing protein [Pararcticibacter amylolyticus]PWG79758.1 hypothetical protein DDR33_15195 [Pararcticibacter amylolyticus]